jgi:hypothetical protein
MRQEKRHMRYLRGVLVLWIAAISPGALALGCWDRADDCALNAVPCGTASSTGSGGDAGPDRDAGPGGDAGPDGDAGTGGKPGCAGNPSAQNITDDCGVFARADAPPGGDGSMAKPFTTLAAAVNEAATSGKRVYACTSAPFTESVTLSAGLEVYGGFDCTKGWSWSLSARSQLMGPADAVALTIEKGAVNAKVEGFSITAASPSDLTMGGSSIAVAIDDVAATLDHCDVTAGDAADGLAGTVPSGTAVKGADAPPPDPGTMNACVLPASVNGGAPGTTTCGSVDTSGGIGGKGGITGTMGGDGLSGVTGNNPAMMPKLGMDGLGGGGQTDPAGTCATGDPGAPGTNGGAGNGGSAMGDMLSLTGITNTDMTDGAPGTPGQGGGGGGGAMSGVFCPPGASPVDGPGASGGGGGAGGCGGLGGGGGKAGGSSIAILSLGTHLTLTTVTLAVGKAGKGGNGTLEQSGGAVGAGAFGGAASGLGSSNPGCKGGDGGKGGNGGPGGGGRGGHAVGIAYATAPASMPVATFTPGMPGSGGTPGSAMGNTGATGAAGPCWDFSANAACK